MLNTKAIQGICLRVAVLLREERLKQNLSMSAVAERASLSQQMVSYVERGLRNPTLDTLLRMSAALNVSLPKILGEAQKA